MSLNQLDFLLLKVKLMNFLEKGEEVDDNLLKDIIEYLKKSDHKRDNRTVACTQDKEHNKNESYDEKEYIKDKLIKCEFDINENFLNSMIELICNKMDYSNRHKRRVIFYYLLLQELKKSGFDLAKSFLSNKSNPTTPTS